MRTCDFYLDGGTYENQTPKFAQILSRRIAMVKLKSPLKKRIFWGLMNMGIHQMSKWCILAQGLNKGKHTLNLLITL